jgi:hypothetical protein
MGVAKIGGVRGGPTVRVWQCNNKITECSLTLSVPAYFRVATSLKYISYFYTLGLAVGRKGWATYWRSREVLSCVLKTRRRLVM